MATVHPITPEMRAALTGGPVTQVRSADMRDTAVDWAKRGFKVFPLIAAGKSPRDKAFYDIATADPLRAAELWTDSITGWPQPWNVGLLMGDGYAAIDVDVKGGKPGMASLAALDLPRDTLTVRTPSGGLHLLYRAPRDVANVSDSDKAPSPLGRGIDVRGWHGYVVAAGSTVEGGRYEIEQDAALAALPPSILDRLSAPRERLTDTQAPACDLDTPEALQRATAFLCAAPVAVEGQGGDAATYQLACAVRDMGVSEAQAVDLIAEHWNPRCCPPWDGDELARKVENAYLYGQNAPGAASPAVDLGGVVELPRPAVIAAAPIVRFLSDANAAVRPSWLVKEWLPREGVVLLAGQSRIGKTFLSLELAGALATGGGFFGRPVRERVGVLILAAEGAGTIAPRLEALRLHRLGGIDATALPIAWAEISDANEIGAIVTAAAAEMQARFGLRLGMIAVDTVAAAFSVDENDAQLATTAMKALGKLAGDAGCLIVAVAHYGKSDGAGVRGSSAWTASADVILAATGEISEITGEVKDRKLALTKSRYAETGPIADFELRSVNLGVDEDGDPISAAIVRPISASAFDPHQALYLESFAGLMLAAAEATPDGRKGVPRELIRQHCYGEWSDSTPATRKKRFARIEERLIAGKHIERAFGAHGVEFVVPAPPVTPATLF